MSDNPTAASYELMEFVAAQYLGKICSGYAAIHNLILSKRIGVSENDNPDINEQCYDMLIEELGALVATGEKVFEESRAKFLLDFGDQPGANIAVRAVREVTDIGIGPAKYLMRIAEIAKDAGLPYAINLRAVMTGIREAVAAFERTLSSAGDMRRIIDDVVQEAAREE